MTLYLPPFALDTPPDFLYHLVLPMDRTHTESRETVMLQISKSTTSRVRDGKVRA
jgi:hypothetical protein